MPFASRRHMYCKPLLKLTTIEDRHKRADVIQVCKILNDRSMIFPKDFLKLSDRMGRKNSLKLFKQRVNKKFRRNGFTSRITDYWNDLPDQVVMAVNAIVLLRENMTA